MQTSAPDDSILFLYRDSALRRAALSASAKDPARYSLYGMDVLGERGLRVAWRIASAGVERRIFHWPGFLIDRAVRARGWPSGMFSSALAMLSAIRAARLVISTVDSLGIPLLWFRRFRFFSTPFIYISVGFPERVQSLNERARVLYARLLRQADAVIAFGYEEAQRLRELVGPSCSGRVRFVPFGAHDAFVERPTAEGGNGPDVLSVGSDPQRDFDMLLEIAARRPAWTFEIVAGGEWVRRLQSTPSNVRVLRDLSLAEVRAHMCAAKTVALPVRENSYSGATTTLLQAMALGRPVVVSRVGAIRDGYGFVDDEHLRWAEPGDAKGFERALADLLGDEARRSAIGTAAARHVARELSWTRFADRLEAVIASVLNEEKAT